MDYYFLAYILLAIFLEFTAVSSLSSQGRSISAFIVAVMFLLIFVFYGQRWFTSIITSKTGQCGSTKLTGGSLKLGYTGPWPPMVNMCPDYLVYYKRNGSTDTCIDISGVNRSGGTLKTWSIEDTTENPPADDMKYFPKVYKPTMTDDDKLELCRATMAAGLTWEGITNGEKCTFVYSETVKTAA